MSWPTPARPSAWHDFCHPSPKDRSPNLITVPPSLCLLKIFHFVPLLRTSVFSRWRDAGFTNDSMNSIRCLHLLHWISILTSSKESLYQRRIFRGGTDYYLSLVWEEKKNSYNKILLYSVSHTFFLGWEDKGKTSLCSFKLRTANNKMHHLKKIYYGIRNSCCKYESKKY